MKTQFPASTAAKDESGLVDTADPNKVKISSSKVKPELPEDDDNSPEAIRAR